MDLRVGVVAVAPHAVGVVCAVAVTVLGPARVRDAICRLGRADVRPEGAACEAEGERPSLDGHTLNDDQLGAGFVGHDGGVDLYDARRGLCALRLERLPRRGQPRVPVGRASAAHPRDDRRRVGSYRAVSPVVSLATRVYVDKYDFAGGFPYQGEPVDGVTPPDDVVQDRWHGTWGGGEGRLTLTPTDWLGITTGAPSPVAPA